jgi:hypothetical protein
VSELVTDHRPFRFDVQEHRAESARQWRERAQAIESMGYSGLYLPDHFGDQPGVIAALMAAADATTKLRIGSLVFDNDYRHPVVLAKEAATLDLLSDGRLDLGLGAGWLLSDYEQAGITFDSAGTRMPVGRFPSPASTTRSTDWRVRRSRSSSLTRRFCWGAVAARCCTSRRARPTSCTSTTT